MKSTRLYLNVPYKEREQAKSLGARWYTTYKKNYHLFKKWFSDPDTNLIICDHLYIAVANRECFKGSSLKLHLSRDSSSFALRMTSKRM